MLQAASLALVMRPERPSLVETSAAHPCNAEAEAANCRHIWHCKRGLPVKAAGDNVCRHSCLGSLCISLPGRHAPDSANSEQHCQVLLCFLNK